jgi:hypothetical protein
MSTEHKPWTIEGRDRLLARVDRLITRLVSETPVEQSARVEHCAEVKGLLLDIIDRCAHVSGLGGVLYDDQDVGLTREEAEKLFGPDDNTENA